jgi:serine phosphatase RsbU (regulator of sigma subunit)
MVIKTGPKNIQGGDAGKRPAGETKATTLDRQIKIQKVLYEIADAASAVTDMQSFYAKLHRIVGRLMYARNFFIALYDDQSGLITWPYYVDTVDVVTPPPTPLADHHGATGWILRHGKTLADVNGSVSRAMKRNEIVRIGTDSDGIGVPLQDDERTLGVLLVQSYKKNIRYTLQDIKILNFVAQHISTALARVRAIEETRQRNAELQIINAVQSALAAELDIHGIYDAVGEKLREIFQTHTLAIYSADLKSRTLRSEYDVEKGQKFPPMDLTFNSLDEYVFNLNQTLVLNGDFPQFAARFSDYKILGNVMPKSILVTPVIAKKDSNRIVSICLFDTEGGKIFSNTDIRLVETVASAMSVALKNARLFDEIQQRNAELAIINSVQEGLASKLDVQAIYELVGDKIRRTFNAQVVSIDTYDHDIQALHGRYYFEAGRVMAGAIYPSFGFRKHVIESRQSMLINRDMPLRMMEYHNPVQQGLQPKSAIFIPMIVGGEAMGVISLQNNDQENAFPESDVRLLTTLASSMGIALENARLWEQEKLYRKALERELEIGREIQSGFLPEILPQVKGWEIAATLLSAREVAGDFYDAFELPGGNIALVIADVCDKGVGAALFMTLFRSLIRAASNLEYFENSGKSNETIPTADRLQRAMLLTNNYIAETHGDSGMFATVFFGILDPQAGNLVYINGGHEPPIILRSKGVDEILHKTGPAVGVIIDCRFNSHETHMDSGDALFAFTDGAPDSRNLNDEEFGHARLMAVTQKACESAHGLVRVTETELRNFIGAATQFDDITLLAVRRC